MTLAGCAATFSPSLRFCWCCLIHAIEVAFESIDVSGPETTELCQPDVHMLKRSRFQAVEAALRVDGGFDEAGVS